MNEIRVVEERPSVDEFIAMRAAMGWGSIDVETARRTVEGAAFSVCLRRDGELLGLARVMGDGVLYFFISDVIVDPRLQGGGYGATLMNAVTGYLDRAAKPGATITVMPLKGREAFYERHGFVKCPNELFGPGMYYGRTPGPLNIP